MALAALHAFLSITLRVDQIVSGIALIVLGAMPAAILFGAADAAQLRLQTLNPDVPYQFFVMAPYVLAILAFVFVARRTRMPAALGTPFRPPR